MFIRNLLTPSIIFTCYDSNNSDNGDSIELFIYRSKDWFGQLIRKMPPKGKKGKKGKSGKKKSKGKLEIVRPTEKEAILQAE